MPHKFILGQGVGYSPNTSVNAPTELYLVIAKLPERNTEFEYLIRHINGSAEFIARESELRSVKA
jgi:hypothetical protein